jgi:hypothetical protein
MIHFKSCFVLFVCCFATLVTASAKADEPQVHPAAGRSTPRRLEATRAASVPQTATPAFGLRLPKILSFGSWSVPMTSGHVVSHGPRPTECRSHCAEGPVTDRTRATTSTVLAGVGALAVVAGVVITVSKPRQSERSVLAPTFRMKLSGQRAVATADWKF